MILRKDKVKTFIEEDLRKNYERYYRLAYSYMNNESDALDVVQEGAYKAIKNANKVKSQEYISTWIYRIIINEAISLLREKKKVTPLFADDSEGKNDNYEDPDLQAAIEGLDLTDQTIIKLRFFEDLPIKDIATITELNENTVKSRLYRALEKLRINLEEE